MTTRTENLIIIGAGGHARSCIDLLMHHGHYKIVGLVGLPDELHTFHLGYEVISSDDSFESPITVPNLLLAVGQIRSPQPRISLFESFKQRLSPSFYNFLSAYVSPFASIGANCNHARSYY